MHASFLAISYQADEQTLCFYVWTLLIYFTPTPSHPVQIDVKERCSHDRKPTPVKRHRIFTRESSPHHNTGFNLHEIKSSQETNSSDPRSRSISELKHTGSRSGKNPCTWEGCLIVALGPAFSEASVLRTPPQLRGSWLRVDLSPASPQAKTGTLLIHRQQKVNLKEVHKADQFRVCLTSTRLCSISEAIGVLLKYASCLWAVPALSKDKRWFEGLLHCIPPQERRAVSGRPAGCYSAARGKKFPSSYWVPEEN